MKYIVVSKSKIRGKSIFNLLSEYLDPRLGEILIGQFDMDFLLYENIDFLFFDYQYYEDYSEKIKKNQEIKARLVLVALEYSKESLGNLGENVAIICGDSSLEDLERLVKIPKKVIGDLDLGDWDKTILFLLSKGLSNKEIGQRLYLSEKTIKNNLSRIYKEINVTNRFQAINKFKERVRES